MEISLWGLGLAVLGLGVRWLFPAVPKAMAWAVILCGLLLLASETVFPVKPPPSFLVLGGLGILCLAGIVHYYTKRAVTGRPGDISSETKFEKAKVTEAVQMSDKPKQYAPGGIINNQTGGVSNNTVNNIGIGPSPRTLIEPIQRELLEKVPKDKKVSVMWVAGDGEAQQFALEIRTFLEKNGFEVGPPGGFMTAGDTPPIELNAQMDPTMLLIGRNK